MSEAWRGRGDLELTMRVLCVVCARALFYLVGFWSERALKMIIRAGLNSTLIAILSSHFLYNLHVAFCRSDRACLHQQHDIQRGQRHAEYARDVQRRRWVAPKIIFKNADSCPVFFSINWICDGVCLLQMWWYRRCWSRGCSVAMLSLFISFIDIEKGNWITGVTERTQGLMQKSLVRLNAPFFANKNSSSTGNLNTN